MEFTDQDALDAIARLMNGNEWDSELVSQIAEIIHHTGRPLKEPVYFHNTTLIQDIEGYLADNHTHLSEQQIKDVAPTIQGKLSYEGIYTQIDSLVLYLLGNLGDSEQTPPE